MSGSKRVRAMGRAERRGDDWRGDRESGLRWAGRADRASRRVIGLMGLGAGVVIMGCSHPAVFDVGSELSPRSAQACVVQNLVDYGYRITDNNRRDGLVRAERQGTFLGFALHDEFDLIEVVIYERDYGETSIQYTAARLEYEHGGAEISGPRGDVEETARDIAYICSGHQDRAR